MENWEKHLNFFLTETESYSQSDKVKTSIVLTCIGSKGLNKIHHIEITDDIKPVVVPVRKIPYALKSKLKEELQRMVNLDII